MTRANTYMNLVTTVTKACNIGGGHVPTARAVLEWLDSHRELLPLSTIPEKSLLSDTSGKAESYIKGYMDALDRAEIMIEPARTANAERMEAWLRRFALETCVSERQLEEARRTSAELADWLDEHGVTAPRADNE